MSNMYVRRFRMVIDFQSTLLPVARLPKDYCWIGWNSSLMTRHADVKYACFQSEHDSDVFPCLGTMAGCHRLMQDIAMHESFLPEATWMIGYRPEVDDCFFEDDSRVIDCATIQGIGTSKTTGSIQNVGVLADHRGLGLGRSLVLKSLHGFRSRGLKRVFLEVTAENRPAVDLYKSTGFSVIRTMYKAVNFGTAGAY
jgi:ribosomal protein S18 acetylase RimI-like enzyme